MSEHLDDDELVAVLEGTASADLRSRVEVHADACARCRELLSMLAGERATQPAKPVSPSPREVAGGRYEIRQLLGSGGMGSVYAAYDPELSRVVALKLLHVTAEGQGLQDRLRREARTMARVSHPNVVAVYDVGTIGERVFVAMEFVDGETLTRWLQVERSVPDILAVFSEAGRGLAAAHAQGLVHRDFKPDNVLIGPAGRVRVTDFGIAKGTVGQAGPLDITGHQLAGTPLYMAPEQCLGESVDARADQFSFCVALYHAVFGVRPFAGETLDQLCAAVLAENRVPPPDPGVVSPRVLHAIVRGLSPVPDARWPSMDALLAELAPAPRRAKRRWAVAAALIGAAGIAGVALRSRHEVPATRTFELPDTIAPTEIGPPSLSPVAVEQPPPEQLSSMVTAATWCAARDEAILVTAYGQVVSVTPAGTVTAIAQLPRKPVTTTDAAVHCRGRTVIVVDAAASLVIDAAGSHPGVSAPANVVDAVDVGTETYWLAPNAVWSWDGTRPPRRVRVTCPHPLRISPDGLRDACLEGDHVTIEDGTQRITGLDGDKVAWSGSALYVASKGTTRRDPGGATFGGGDPLIAGDSVVTHAKASLLVNGNVVADLGSRRVQLLAAVDDHSIVVAVDGAVRVIDLRHPSPPPPDRHASEISLLAFAGSGVWAMSADGRLILHSFPGRTLVADQARGTALRVRDNAVDAVDGAVIDGMTVSVVDGQIVRSDGKVLVPAPLQPETRVIAVTGDSVLVKVGNKHAQLLDIGSGHPSLIVNSSHDLWHVALGPDHSIVVADQAAQGFVVDASGVTPLVKLTGSPITALAVGADRVAYGSGRDVIVFDLSSKHQIGHARLDSTATALAWDRDARRLAAAGASKQLSIWSL